MVASLCDQLRVPHSTLTAQWKLKPQTAIQERARIERYKLLGEWASRLGLAAVVTAHHLDDQVETLVMRLNRGAGARGLAGMRAVSAMPGGKSNIALIRPLLGWRRSALVGICEAAGLTPVDDPSNREERFERVRIRNGLGEANWLDVDGIGRSARNLAEADAALDWAAEIQWKRQVSHSATSISYSPAAPMEIRRRVVQRAVASLATEGRAVPLRGPELDRLVSALSQGQTTTLRGVLCAGGDIWRFSPAPRRRTRPQP